MTYEVRQLFCIFDGDSWSENDGRVVGSVELGDEAEDAAILKALQEANILRPDITLDDMVIGGDDMMITIDDVEGVPNYTLYAAEDVS